MVDLVNLPTTTKILPSKFSCFNSIQIASNGQPPKYYHPNAFSNFIHQKLTPPKFCAIRYMPFMAPTFIYVIVCILHFLIDIQKHVDVQIFTLWIDLRGLLVRSC